ncbi:MAG: hypothetical protein ACK5O7_02590 [Holosporales bacterium]
MMIKFIPALIACVAATQVYASTITTEDDAAGKWTRTFTLSTGTKVTHLPTKVIFQDGDGRKVTLGGGYAFGKGSKLNSIVALDDGYLQTASSLESFRKEVAKFGAIISESDE